VNIDADKYPLFLQMGPALVRGKDPSSSRRGSCWVQGSGRLGRQEAIVLKAVTAAPGSTAREIAKTLDCGDVNVPARRLASLAERGLVRRGPERRCGVTGMTAQAWYPIGTLPASRSAVSRPKPRDRGPILSVEQRRAMRERLAVEGDESQRRFLAALSERGD
jgi:hypothetical protein